MSDRSQRLMFIHAHPDDESIMSAGTIAQRAAAGDEITIVTFTRGERGGVLPDHLRHLEGDEQALGWHRAGELAAAAAALGVDDVRFLGQEAGLAFSDSGMVWSSQGTAGPAPDASPNALTRVEIATLADLLFEIVRDVQPDVIVGYDPTGGYGHPDHIRVYEVCEEVMRRVNGSDIEPERYYWGYFPFDPPPEATTIIDVSEALDVKAKALAAHQTQLEVHGTEKFDLGDIPGLPIAREEFYQLRGGHSMKVDEAGESRTSL